jgi:putative endonuclease
MSEHFVYIIANHAKTLYTGVTNNLQRRVLEHKQGLTPGFTQKYRINQLVWFESFVDVNEAIEWEKRIKGWARAKKVA